MARARALLAQPFSQKVGPGELEVPAIRALGGSLLYFTDAASPLARLWEVDFRESRKRGRGKDAGLLAVDHVSQSMDYAEMLSWLLFYTSIFAMDRTPQVDVADPAGLVRSQVVEGPDGAVRIVLNGAPNERTLSGRFLAAFLGSGVQHIAFSSADIRRTAAALSAGGVALLAVPDNYYDDLEARFGLPPDTIAEMKAGRLLYDRDERGEYFQLYTEPFAGRFFFEIVERRGGYRGYGAANAPIRLAAQARLELRLH
jgi:4-hydroxyphenylpyruvate dioxygenase